MADIKFKTAEGWIDAGDTVPDAPALLKRVAELEKRAKEFEARCQVINFSGTIDEITAEQIAAMRAGDIVAVDKG